MWTVTKRRGCQKLYRSGEACQTLAGFKYLKWIPSDTSNMGIARDERVVWVVPGATAGRQGSVDVQPALDLAGLCSKLILEVRGRKG
jgi:hypothetical protein